ncbi:uncharacterized protein LOC132561744 [Ylistrum balloti]|uniref:uncharacterized protein LOC132561744 n=1 Tax=Ylistrum balloti TaxID=509963 RepID=UPI002905A56D|nr:uncharacterized protein LOC132561744 [Ylistrum balloti]
MGYISGIFRLVVATTLWHYITGTFYYPPNTTESLAFGTEVMASSICPSGSTTYIGCNYCATRNNWPQQRDVLQNLNEDATGCSNSVKGDMPGSAERNNGALSANQSSNCTFSVSIPAVTNKGYTISFWIRQSTIACDDCPLFSLTSGSNTLYLKITNRGRNIVLASASGSTIKSNLDDNVDKWKHIVLRFLESTCDYYLDGGYRNSFVKTWFPSFSTKGDIKFDNYSVINPSTATIKLLDLRFFVEAITQREIVQLSSSSSPDMNTPPLNCRCPPTHPILRDSSSDNLLVCSNRTSNTVPRLRTETHLPIFAIDNDPDTSWVTKPTERAWIFLRMNRVYQVDGITIEVNNTIPLYVILQFGSNLGTDHQDVTIQPDSNTTTWSSGSITDIDTRSELMKRLVSTINITLSGHADSADDYRVVEIKINRRFNCFGNADHLQVGGGCACLSITRTTGEDCGTCHTGYYQSPDDFNCPYPCNCSSAPGIETTGQCNQDAGGCLCKTNVQGYHCDTCKNLFFNLTSSNVDGCMPCTACDQSGSASCDNNGACQCKSHVTGTQCNSCAPNHYGLRDPGIEGCQPCACSTEGTDTSMSTVCDTVSGNCTCKLHVTGRQCDMCKPGFKKLNFRNSMGCEKCLCNKVGSQDITSCDMASGQCLCLYTVSNNLQCNPMFDSDSLVPAFGPVAGGTDVTVTGNFFKHNSDNTEVKVLDISRKGFFTIKILEEKRLVFVTNSSSDTGLINIEVQWPGSVGMEKMDFRKKFTFTFKANPVVTEPMNATVFKSGGCFVKIKGSNFGSVFKSRLITHVRNTEVLQGPCITVGESLINCLSPDLRNYTGLSTTSYGLQLDGLKMYEDLSAMFPGGTIKVIEDPTVEPNNALTIDNVFTKNLVIKGSNFDKACEDNIEVKLGDDVCPIESLTSDQITCSPVIRFPGETKESELKVIIGNFQSTVGVVKIKSFWITWQFIIIAAGVGGAVILIITTVIIVKCCHRCQKNKMGKDRKHSNEGSVDGVDLFSYTHIETDIRSSMPGASQFDSLETPIVPEKTTNNLPRRNNYTDMSGHPLTPIESEESIVETFLHKLEATLRDEVNSSLSKRSVIKLGLRCTQKGAEIRVIDGQFQEGPFQGQDATIKTTVQEFKDFGEDILPRWVGSGLAETLRFRDCFQENIHRSCGITVDENRFYVLYPATQRILKEYLRDRKQEFTFFSLIEICQKIAEAMDYLSSSDIVHRDIASRNCVVCPGDVVKITDASFSWSLFPDEYMYDSERERWLPVRWMAQDSLQYGFYSTSTDVWSYGVLMWEVMSRGVVLPYFDIEKNEDIKDHVISGFRLGKPETVPDEMYSLMLSCWDTDHTKRPAFVRIIERLMDILNPPESPSKLYQNQQNDELPEYGNIPDDRPKLPSRANMPPKNGNINFGYR